MHAATEQQHFTKATLCLALSGRHWAWAATARFLEQQTYPHHLISLHILDTSGSTDFHQTVKEWVDGADYATLQLEKMEFGHPGLADLDRPSHENAVRAACAAIYAHFAKNVVTPLVFTLEDDIEPPTDLYERLGQWVTGNVISASAYYLGRLVGDAIAWSWDSNGKPASAQPGSGVGKVGGHGFGAAVFQRTAFLPECFHAELPLHDFDYNFFHKHVVVENKEAVVDWDCVCRHYSGSGKWVQNPATALQLNLLKGSHAPLSIVHLNAYDHHGGAERLANNLIDWQKLNGHQGLALVGHKTRADTDAIAFDTAPDLEARERCLKEGWPDYEFRGSHDLPNHPAVQNAAVIHAHNLYGGYFHPHSLIALSHFRPVVWSIHDMQALTGYCSHALDCELWQRGCGQCPDLTKPGPSLPFDNTAALWRDKQLISENSRLWIAAGSTWMVRQLEQSLLKHHPIHFIPNGIPTDVFHPTNRSEMRKRLNLPSDALIIGSLARTGILSHPWKGGSYALEALQALREVHPNLIFLDIGATRQNPDFNWIVPVSPETPELLRDTLGTLDFFLYPSIADTAPLAVLEALACGLPVVGFQTGGIPDMVTEQEGILVPTGDTKALILATQTLAASPEMRQQMSKAARLRAETRFDTRHMAAGYEKLYYEAIVQHAGKRLATHTTTVATSSGVHHLQEITALQNERLQLKAKLRDSRIKREALQQKTQDLLQHRWTRWGVKAGAFRGSLKKWLMKHQPPA